MIVYALVYASDSWGLFVTTDEGDTVPGQEMTALLRRSDSRRGLFLHMLRALIIKPGDVWIEDLTEEEYGRLRHPGSRHSPVILTGPPQGVATYLQLAEIIRQNS